VVEAVGADAPYLAAEVGPAAGGGSAGARRPSLGGSAGAVGGGSAAGAPLHDDPPLPLDDEPPSTTIPPPPRSPAPGLHPSPLSPLYPFSVKTTSKLTKFMPFSCIVGSDSQWFDLVLMVESDSQWGSCCHLQFFIFLLLRVIKLYTFCHI
jgi:hypothetical protein